MSALLPFWGDLKLSHVKGETCRRYGKWRGVSPSTVRRELGTLQAAMNYAHREGYVTSAPVVTLPDAAASKDRWLTRDEAAKLIWTAYRGHKSKHIARFILIGLYTGTRKDAILRMALHRIPLAAGLIWTGASCTDAAMMNGRRKSGERLPRYLANCCRTSSDGTQAGPHGPWNTKARGLQT